MTYLVEIRLRGYAKRYLKELIGQVSRRFKILRKAQVPHITLYGSPPQRAPVFLPGKTEKDLVGAFSKFARNYRGDLVRFRLKGFDYFARSGRDKVIYVDVEPSEELKSLRWELSKVLREIVTPNEFDLLPKDKFEFHATIAFKDKNLNRKFEEVLDFLKKHEEPNIPQSLLRLTLLKRGRILYEYDFLLGRRLNRIGARSQRIWRETVRLLKARVPKGYLILDFEATRPPDARGSSEDEITEIGAVKLSESYEAIGQFQSFVRPTRYPFIGEHRKKIGGFSQREIDGADSFPEVLKRVRLVNNAVEP